MSSLDLHDSAGNADHGGMLRHRRHKHGTGADPAMTPDSDRSEHRRTAKDRYRVFNRRVTLDRRRRCSTEGDALIDRYVVADFARLADHHAHAMIDETA